MQQICQIIFDSDSEKPENPQQSGPAALPCLGKMRFSERKRFTRKIPFLYNKENRVVKHNSGAGTRR